MVQQVGQRATRKAHGDGTNDRRLAFGGCHILQATALSAGWQIGGNMLIRLDLKVGTGLQC